MLSSREPILWRGRITCLLKSRVLNTIITTKTTEEHVGLSLRSHSTLNFLRATCNLVTKYLFTVVHDYSYIDADIKSKTWECFKMIHQIFTVISRWPVVGFIKHDPYTYVWYQIMLFQNKTKIILMKIERKVAKR